MKHLAALFVSICILGMGTGLGTSLLGIRSTIEDFSPLAIGIALAGYYAGILVGSRLIGGLLANVGHIRVFAGLASVAFSAALLHALFLNPAAWLVLRVFSGFCMSGIYITAESWLNNIADNRNRGRILSTYMVISMGGGTLGQLLIGVDHPAGFGLFILTSALVTTLMSSATASPLLLTGVMLVYGALTFPVYALSMSHMNDLLEPAQLVSGAAALVTFMGSGAIAGPVLTAALMTLMGPSGMWIALAGLHSLFAVYIIHRFVKRPRIPLALQKVFAPIPIRSSARVAYLIHRNRNKPEED